MVILIPNHNKILTHIGACYASRDVPRRELQEMRGNIGEGTKAISEDNWVSCKSAV